MHEITQSVQEVAVAEQVDRITTDHCRMAEITMNYLVSIGHRTIAYLAPFSRRQSDEQVTYMQHVASQQNVALSCINIADYMAPPLPIIYEVVRDLPERPTAIIAHGDKVAASIIQGAVNDGKRIPEDLSVFSTFCSEYHHYFLPPITGINSHPEETGRVAARLLFQRLAQMQGGGTAPPPETLTIQPELIIRESCAPPRH
ncbi:MAG: substrate-binding domain-containing protein [Armatimonadota bacterium]